MASMRKYAYKGCGEVNKTSHWYSSAIRVGDQIHCAGQGSFYNADFNISKLVSEQIDQAFVTMDTALKHTGAKGWSQAYRVNSYHIQLDQEAQDAMVRSFKKWMPDNHPVWTCVQIGRLGHDATRVEIEVSAFGHEGAKEAGTSRA
ncbi:Endoribonuclease L-PSP/chorismate mutase-like protein [Aspergillus pseudotamarii]|uniref:Endoribonuclease L-PSP/chorismate mutase-like protein n=1 Tax=Aspergillus pseudotamarii TaxID=132259 RepID=A0A5N6STA7_ASPPS|nr:Endoribonuclease L-PSP/chorismate mutase-like protein [Aspergillus pseudotamarii]KAE8137117.1 Endoribonuclease L-PSP/chorismate mutase-like protein [Aspergillus pseudotamarii]